MKNEFTEKSNILTSLFDIKPVNNMGRVDVEKIYKIKPVVNLAKKKAPADATRKKLVNSVGAAYSTVIPTHQPILSIAERKSKLSITSSPHQEKLISQDELEKFLNSTLNIKQELKNFGGRTVIRRKIGKPRIRPIPGIQRQETRDKRQETETPNTYLVSNIEYNDIECGYEAVLKQINEKITPNANEFFVGEPKKLDPVVEILNICGKNKSKSHYGAGPFEHTISEARSLSEIENRADYARSNTRSLQFSLRQAQSLEQSRGTIYNFQSIFDLRVPKLLLRTYGFLKKTRIRISTPSHKFLVAISVVVLSSLIFASLGHYGISVKNEVLRESNLAVANLEQANESLRVFDFQAASNNFAEAYGEFSKAGDSLNFMGASMTSLFAELPGAGKLKSAKNLVEAGKLLAEAGKSMSEAVNSLSQTSAIFDPNHESRIQNYEFANLKRALLSASGKLSKSSVLISDVNPDVLPEEKREMFAEFKSKLPEFESVVSDAVEYVGFLENLLGPGGVKKYLILFQNNSELRPTGGFSGTYAVVTFKDGRLDDFLVDDVYNLDGQLKENIIPPIPLQHITPNWGMRDANWFADFSVSAQKVMEFFKKEAGYEVDGVLTMSPQIISDILKVVGPIEMPEYGLTINSENFLSTIQAEVEYGDNREQPKQVVKDMAPELLERIYSSDSSQWLDIFSAFISGLDKKDTLMYFRDLNLERFVSDKGFGGLIKNTDEDYLMVTFTNVKGSKTDKVIDNSIRVSARFEGGSPGGPASRMIHKLELTRQHNGGSLKYGFYNKQSPAYVRVLVPEGSELLNITGNSNPGYKPLINYSNINFKRDEDLFRFESGFYSNNENGMDIFRESGKTGFAFWLITDPGKQKKVELEYAVPFEYGKDSYGIYVQKQPGLEVDNFEFQVGNAYIYNGEFEKDLELRFRVE